LRKGFIEYIDNYYSNEDVKNPKPKAEIYLRCMIDAGVDPDECLIVEDSIVGRKAALKSGGNLHPVLNTNDINLDKIIDNINKINNNKLMKPKWKDDKMKVLIPMAGAGTRFEKAGYTFPKPLIEVRGKPMIQVVIDSIGVDAKHVFIAQKSHYEKYNLKDTLNLISPNCEVALTEGLTEVAKAYILYRDEHARIRKAKDIYLDVNKTIEGYLDNVDWRVKDLSLSRAFGDLECTPYVSHLPQVYRYKISNDDNFLIKACDGLWDVVSNQDAVDFILDLKKNKNFKGNYSKSLCDYAYAKGSLDNVTVIVYFF
jgi:hypothetical protein